VSACIFAGLGLCLIVPAYVTNRWWLNVHGDDEVTFGAFVGFLSILCGTSNGILVSLLVLCVVAGLYWVLRDDLLCGMVFLSIMAALFLYLQLATQDGMHAPIQIARYSITFFPVCFVLAAYGMAATARALLPAVTRPVFPVVLIVGLLVGSPLWAVYTMPKNFTNHSVFQDTYDRLDWSKSLPIDWQVAPPMRANGIPPIYRDAAFLDSVAGIIEYPMLIGDPVNLYYFYQHYHRKEVAVGYLTSLSFPPLASNDDFVYIVTSVDYILGRAGREPGGRLRFRNLVRLDDLSVLPKRYDGWALIVHRNVLAEIASDTMRMDAVDRPSAVLVTRLKGKYGEPLFVDDRIAVWRIGE
jgi:hypothetical protein